MGTVRMSVTGIFIDPKIVIVFFIIAGLSVYTVNAQTCPVEGHPPEKVLNIVQSIFLNL